MTREEAERHYVDAIMLRGNPMYFVWEAVRRWDDESLIERMDDMGIHIDEIEDEE